MIRKARLVNSIPLLVYFAVFLVAILTIRYHRVQNPNSPVEAEIYDLFIISSYHYETSKSLGNNMVALVLTGDFDVLDRLGHLNVTSSSEQGMQTKEARLQRITMHNVCRWISMLVIVPVVPNMNKLAISTGDKLVEIPYTAPSKRHLPVVSCIAPLFANEQWQMALFALHTYRRFGSHMHLYVRSMVSPLFELMKEYEKEDYLTIQPWLRINLTTIGEDRFNPNINVEFRSQAAAQTDCLLQYKESAEFISFVDLDDVLIPRLGRTYHEEYSHLFHSIPKAAYLHYTKENVHITAHQDSELFSLAHMYSSIEFRQINETGKYVTKPIYINSTWIHWPNALPDGMESYIVPNDINAITHLKTVDLILDEEQDDRIVVPEYRPFKGLKMHSSSLLLKNDIVAIEEDYKRMSSLPTVSSILPRLPTDFYYFHIIAKCFHDTFYSFHYSGQQSKMKCPGPDRCELPPSPGIDCYNSVSSYRSIEGTTVNLHFHLKDGFIEENGCRQ